jgi:hypothetical protein
MYQKFTNSEMGANNKCPMEADTISKNGRSSKSQMSRRFFLSKACFVLLLAGLIFGGCNKDDSSNGNGNGNEINNLSYTTWYTYDGVARVGLYFQNETAVVLEIKNGTSYVTYTGTYKTDKDTVNMIIYGNGEDLLELIGVIDGGTMAVTGFDTTYPIVFVRQ